MDMRLVGYDTEIVFDASTGGVKSLIHAPTGVEFAGNAQNNVRLTRDDSPRLGHVRMRIGLWGGPWRLEDTRWTANIDARYDANTRRVDVVCPGGAGGENGVRSLRLDQNWSMADGGAAFSWRLRLTHTGDPADDHVLPLRIGELSLPLVFNTHFGGRGDQDLIYDRRVMVHPFACGYNGYVTVQRLSGQAPILLMVPTQTTPLEALAHDNADYAAGGGWDGLLSAYCWSKAADEWLNWNSWYHGCRFLELKPGASHEIGFDFYWLEHDGQIDETLRAAGALTFRSHPGYVTPINHPCLLRVAGPAVESIREVTVGGGGRAVLRNGDASARVYELHFEQTGACGVCVSYGDGQWTNLPYQVTPDARRHLEARAKFIAERQYFRRPGHRMDHAFLMWDAETNDCVLEAPDTPWLVGGSDEGGLADPLALSAKSVVAPDPAEIDVLETYVDTFLFGVLQNRDDFGVRNWIAHEGDVNAGLGGKTNRSFNYPHVWNVYLNLYRVARDHGLTRVRGADAYLEMAYRTVLAFFTLPMHLEHNVTKGNMGEETLVDLAAACEAEGKTAWASELRTHMRRKIEHMTRQRNPYLSELNFDTTGYPSAYLFRRLAGDDAGAEATLRVIRATRHQHPGWPWHASDVRWGWGNSKHRNGDEICLNYMTSLNALPLIDAFERDGRLDCLRLGYAALLAVWALVEPDGVAHDFYGWEPGRRRFDPWTSEMGLALFPTIRKSTAYVADDPELGRIGFGCAVEDVDRVLRVTPLDAARQRLWVAPLGVELAVNVGTITQARFVDGAKRIELDIEPPTAGASECALAVKGGAQTYEIRVGDRVLAFGARVPLAFGATTVTMLAR